MRDWEGTSLPTPNLVGSGLPSVRLHWEARQQSPGIDLVLCFRPIFVCLLSVAFLCVPVPFLFFCVFIVSSVIMGQSSSTPLSVMTDHEDRESQKKPILQESSLYPSLIDVDTEISPPPYMQPPLPLQVPQVLSVEQRRDPEPSALPWEGGLAQGTRGRT